MKKSLIFIAALAAGVMVISSCSSSKESAYRKAYEKAKAQEKAQQAQQPAVQEPAAAQPQVTPLVEAPAQQPADYNAPVRSESVSLVSGSGIRAYSVVVGSFGVQANAEALRQRLNNSGYQAQVAKGNSNGRDMYRVLISTSDTREGAVQSRNSVRGTYPDAWILQKQ